MQQTSQFVYRMLLAVGCLWGGFAQAQDAPPSMAVVISIAEEKLAILRDGGLLKKYPVSTSKFGVGDSFGSYKTPLGQLKVCEKIGDDLSPGAVIKQRHATGEVLPVNAPGRDPIVTRILWLDGLEDQNHNARSRGIYIHGTPEESKIGKPVSYGCIRMRSQDVLEVFDQLPLGTPVLVMNEKFPKYPKWTPPKPTPIIVAAPTPTPKPIAVVATPTPAKTAAVAVVTTPKPGFVNTASNAVITLPPAAPGKKVALLPNPAPVADHHPLTAAAGAKSETPGSASGEAAMVNHAMKGSMLMAGLPEGPSVVNPEPKDVPRFNPLSPAAPAAATGLSLGGENTDLSNTPLRDSSDPNAKVASRTNPATGKKP